jgi:hypothetical protein
MKVCTYQGLLIAVLTRYEHCPPHVHVSAPQWEARFEFSFWHNGIRLWDVVPAQQQPKVAVLEGLRQVLKTPIHLKRARVCWWQSMKSLCLVNQLWDEVAQEVVSPHDKRLRAQVIQAASFDEQRYRTILQLAGNTHCVEIEL